MSLEIVFKVQIQVEEPTEPRKGKRTRRDRQEKKSVTLYAEMSLLALVTRRQLFRA